MAVADVHPIKIPPNNDLYGLPSFSNAQNTTIHNIKPMTLIISMINIKCCSFIIILSLSRMSNKLVAQYNGISDPLHN